MRIDKFLSNMGLESRKGVAAILKSGVVTVDGLVVKDKAFKIDAEKNVVSVEGEVVKYKKYIYIMMNKPAGLLSATRDEHEETVLSALPDELAFFAPFPVGRLDRDTVGLLLLTNDGVFAHRTLSPKKHVEKEYRALVTPMPTPLDVETFAKGVTLEDGYVCKPARLELPETTEHVGVTITEGKYHQIKRMFAAVGKNVTYLQRVRFGDIWLDRNLAAGECRELTEAEMKLIKRYTAYSNHA